MAGQGRSSRSLLGLAFCTNGPSFLRLPLSLARALPIGKDHPGQRRRGTRENAMRRQQKLWMSPVLPCAALLLGLFTLLPTQALGETAKQLRIGVQFGLGYLPLYIADEAHLFEKRMREQ